MPYHIRRSSSRRQQAFSSPTSSIGNFEPLINDALQDDDEIQIVETPHYGMSVDSFNLYHESREIPPPSGSRAQEVHLSALASSTCIGSKHDSFSAKKGADGPSVAVCEVMQGELMHTKLIGTVTKSSQDAQSQRPRLQQPSQVSFAASRTAYTHISTQDLFSIFSISGHG